MGARLGSPNAQAPSLTTFELSGSLLDVYKGYQMHVVEWMSKLFATTRILNEWHIPVQFVEIENRRVFSVLPDTAAGYNGRDVFCLTGTGGCRIEMGDSQDQIRAIWAKI